MNIFVVYVYCVFVADVVLVCFYVLLSPLLR